mgnify:FL=1
MTFTLPVSGTNPKIATKEGLEAAVNAAIGAVAASGVTGFPYFANTTLGIAGTVDGGGFTTSDGASMFFYLNNSGTADLLAEVGTPLADSRIDAVEADLLALNGRVMGSFTEAESAAFGASVEVVWVKFDGLLLAFQPDDSGTCWQDSAGQTFSPLGNLPTFIQHWKVSTNATKELSRSAVDAMTSGQRTAHQTSIENAHLHTEGDLILNGWVEILDEVIIGQRCVPVVIDGIAGEALSCGFFATSRYDISANSVFTAGATGAGSYAPYVKSLSIALDQSEAETAGQIAYNVAISAAPADIAAAIAASNAAFAGAFINYPAPFVGKEAFGVVDSMRITGMPNPATWQAPTFGATNDDNIGGWEVKNLQLSGFNTDLLVENGFHFFKLGRVDDWVWDLGPRAQDYRNRDVTTGVKREAIYFGRLDSLIADHIGIFQGGQIVYDKGEGNSITDQFGTIQLDGDGASLTLRSGRSQIGMLYGTEDVALPALSNKILCEAGTHDILGGSLIGDSLAMIKVTGGRVVYSGILRDTNTQGHGGLVTGGQLIFEGTHFVVGVEGGATPFTYLNWQVGYLQQSGTGELVVKANCTAEAFLSGSVQGGSTLEPWQFTKVLNNNTGCNIEPSPRRRVDMVSALSGTSYCLFPIKGSRTYTLDGYDYIGNSTATILPDLQGLLAADEWNLFHFGAKCDGVANDGLAVKVAATLGIPVRTSGTILMDNHTVTIAADGGGFYGGGKFYVTGFLVDPSTTDGYSGFFRLDGVKGFTFDSVDFGRGVGTGRVHGVTAVNCEEISLRNVNCDHSDQAYSHLYLFFIWKYSKNCSIVDCRVLNSGNMVATGGDFASGSATGLVEGVQILNNYCKDVQSEAIDINYNTHDVVIDNNTLINCAFGEPTGEPVDIGGGDCDNIKITNNTINNSGDVASAIWVKLGTKRVLIQGNVIDGGWAGGTDNTSKQAIQLHTDVEDVIITDNIISGYSRFTNTYQVLGVVITNNHVTCDQVGGFNSGDVIVSGNKFIQNSSSSFIFGEFATGDRQQFTNNVCYLSDTAPVGFRMQTTSVGGIFSDNTIIGGMVSFRPDGDATRVVSNLFVDASTKGITLVGSGVTVTQNTFLNCAMGLDQTAGSNGLVFTENLLRMSVSDTNLLANFRTANGCIARSNRVIGSTGGFGGLTNWTNSLSENPLIVT